MAHHMMSYITHTLSAVWFPTYSAVWIATDVENIDVENIDVENIDVENIDVENMYNCAQLLGNLANITM